MSHTPGPWFIWKERAMQEEGMEADEIHDELLMENDFCVMAGTPVRITRGSVMGCKQIVEVDAFDFVEDDDQDESDSAGRALSVARLIAAAPTLLKALQMLLSYTLACEAMLNAKPAGQIDIARAAISLATGAQEEGKTK